MRNQKTQKLALAGLMSDLSLFGCARSALATNRLNILGPRRIVMVRRNAFTLVELLVVIGIIALLISILLPALSAARESVASIKCLAQMKQLGNAFSMYVNDNKGWMPSCDTCGPLRPETFYDGSGNSIFPSISAKQTWVGWVDGGPDPATITNGTLWPYIKNAAVYKCPSDFNIYRALTYSMNYYLCTSEDPYAGTVVNMFKIYKISSVRDTTNTIEFVEEADPRSYGASVSSQTNSWNVGGWEQTPQAADSIPGTDSQGPSYWVDTIPSWHRGGTNLSYVDGHSEHFRYSDKRTVNYLKNDPTWPSPFYSTPNNPDLVRIRQQVVTWARQR